MYYFPLFFFFKLYITYFPHNLTSYNAVLERYVQYSTEIDRGYARRRADTPKTLPGRRCRGGFWKNFPGDKLKNQINDRGCMACIPCRQGWAFRMHVLQPQDIMCRVWTRIRLHTMPWCKGELFKTFRQLRVTPIAKTDRGLNAS